jgi:hypothetical protein
MLAHDALEKCHRA